MPACETRHYVIELITEMLGTAPKDPNIYATWIESKKPPKSIKETEANQSEEAEEESEAQYVEKLEERGWTGFLKDPEKGLFIYDYMIKGMLKNAGKIFQQHYSVTKVSKRGITSESAIANLKGKITDNLFVYPRKIFLGKMEPDGYIERPLRALTPAGQIVTLVRSDYVAAGTRLEFDIKLYKNPVVTWDIVDDLLSYGQDCGLGQFRNGSYGRFKVIEWKSVEVKADFEDKK